jgi:hypothetical protein
MVWVQSLNQYRCRCVLQDDNATPPADAAPASVRTISRRDATAFVRSVRRWGLSGALAKIAAEVGPVLEEASPAVRLSLWHALLDGCRQAVDITVADQQDAKVRVWCVWWGFGARGSAAPFVYWMPLVQPHAVW